MDSAFRHVWHHQHPTWTDARLRVILAGLKRELPDGELGELVRLHEDMMTREWEVRQFERAVTGWELARYFESV